MSAHTPIGSCCSRPRLNFVGGIDDQASTFSLNDTSLVSRARKLERTTIVLVGSILAALAVVYASAISFLSD